MTIKDIILDGSGLLAVVATLLQIAPVKINPWSWIAKRIGNAINTDVLEKLNAVEERLNKHIITDDRRTADSSRTRILHFNNELLRDLPHTKEEFIEVLAEIDAYEKYCREHPEYPNNRAILAIENIRDTYKKRLAKHDFLQE